MMYAVSYDEEIRLWWDPRKEKTDTRKYRVLVDGKRCVYTDKVYYNFKNLEAGREYTFTLCLVDDEKRAVGKEETYKASTLPKRTLVDVTKAPYNAVGDGETDNTACIQRALDDCRKDKLLYFPEGVYVCENVTFFGNANVRMDVGAVLCNEKRGKTL